LRTHPSSGGASHASPWLFKSKPYTKASAPCVGLQQRVVGREVDRNRRPGHHFKLRVLQQHVKVHTPVITRPPPLREVYPEYDGGSTDSRSLRTWSAPYDTIGARSYGARGCHVRHAAWPCVRRRTPA
ncbi:hypothetical protein DFH09DRAFT_1371302, partial [Mycena vulgaris]